MKDWVYLGIAILSEVIAATALKESDNFSKPLFTTIVILGYLNAFYLFSLTLRTIPLGIAYAIWAGAGVVLVAISAWIIYGQKLDLAAIVGMGFIILGILVMNIFSKSIAH
ncbi:DMT family transporter [Candidatus Nitrosacidococcus tergens]|uniref:Quaternary ammonium compound-resistance protein QacF n=1 Tax=Candidatus Nitrosacidococcus tergens TaxID=553981 RepID=A0A7G1Q831_9GAMM|nr:SMR family transporter [Candidatus Nitrosacidococcus tergens]CAB1274401.1 Quaternary ammonium compound-resistance protein QacF [Candidatus Nitrosacidococcus tergens]